MSRQQHYLFNLALAINSLLIFLLIFESRIVVPAWLQVVGRFHPVVLHFPIVLSLIYGLFVLSSPWLFPAAPKSPLPDWILLLAASLSAITALAGFFLSKENGYESTSLPWHKWFGCLLSVFLLVWAAFRNQISQWRFGSAGMAVICVFSVIVTGHQGAVITHGENFLLAPVFTEKTPTPPSFDKALVFADLVRPILKEKCMSCHNRTKARGQLVMETEESLIRGGRGGKLWDSTATDFGLLMQRIHLPAAAKKHMPPAGKPQLTEEEVALIESWLKAGASFQLKAADLPVDHPLRKLAEARFQSSEERQYDFAAADEATVRSLNSNYRVVYPLAKGSPALGAEFFGASSYQSAALGELDKIRNQLVELNLEKMPLREEDIRTISGFSQLRKLNLSFTGIRGEYLAELSQLKNLEQLAVSGTKITDAELKKLKGLASLQRIFIWNSPLTTKDVRAAFGNSVIVETGFQGDSILLRLTPPLIENEEQVIIGEAALRMKHYVNGVTIRYSLDGTAPDSLHSRAYSSGDRILGDAHLRAIAYKPGWLGSDTAVTDFFAAHYRADSVTHLLPFDNGYRDEGGKTLIDLRKGDRNFRSGRWVGFRNNDMAALFTFSRPITVERVNVGSLVDIGSYLMPPESLELWIGNDPEHLVLMARLKPSQPGKILPSYFANYQLVVKPASGRFFKIIAHPVLRLPAWHPGKGQRGWFFTDEVIFN